MVADGAILVSVKPVACRKAKENESDPLLVNFLQFMKKQKNEHPQDIVAADADQLRRIGKLVEGVDAT